MLAARRAYSTGVGRSLLQLPVTLKGTDGKDLTMKQLFEGRKVVVFGLPGAFTPVCNLRHVPGFANRSADLKKLGVAEIVCVSVNDHFVMKAWADSLQTGEAVRLVADGNAAFTRAIGQDVDLSAGGLGVRSKRYSMLVDNGVVVTENVEKSPGDLDVSGADAMLSQCKL